MMLRKDVLVDAGLERRLKAAVAARLENRPAERKQVSRWRWGRVRGAVWPLVGLVALCGAALALMYVHGLDDVGRLGLASTAVFFVALVRRSVLWGTLNASPDLFALALWPTEPEQVFRRQWNIGMRNWLAELLTVSFCAGLVQENPVGPVAIVGLLVGFVILRSVSIAVAAVFALWPRLLQLGWFGLGLLGISIYVTRSEGAAAQIARFWNATGNFWTAVLPTGWVLRPIHAALTGAPWSAMLLLIPAVATALLLPWAAGRLRREYRYRDAVLLQYAAEGLPEWSDDEARQFQELLVQIPKAVPERMRESVLLGEFLHPAPSVDRGPLGAVVWRWLGERERLVLEWGQLRSLALESNVRNAAILAIVGITAAFIFRAQDPMVGVIVGVATSVMVLLVMRAGVMQRVFQPIQDLALESPWLAFVPVSVSEVAAIFTKIAVVLTPVAVAILAVVGWVIARLGGAEPVEWAGAGMRLGLVLPAVSLLDVILRLNRYSNVTWRGSLVHAFLLLPVFLLCAAGFVATVMWSSGWCVLIPLGVNLVAFAGFQVARWSHQRHHFDLIRKIQTNG